MKNLIIFICFFYILLHNLYSQSWERCGDELQAIKINCIATSGKNIFAGTYEGVFFSSNNGDSWNAVNNGLTYKKVYCITTKGNKIFAGTENGVFLSTNFGQIWYSANNGLGEISNVGAISALISDSLYIYTGPSAGGLYKSSDDGKVWKMIFFDKKNLHVDIIAIDNKNISFANGSGLTISKDGGSIWKNFLINNRYVDIRSLAIRGENIWVGTGNESLMFSTDNGSNFTYLLSQNNFYISSMLIEGDLVACGTIHGFFYTIYDSNNYDKEWLSLNNGLTNSFYNYLAINKEFIFDGTDSGVYRLPKRIFNTPDAAISGEGNACVGDTIIYSTKYEDYAKTTWAVEGGNFIGSDDSSATIYWASAGVGKVSLLKKNKVTYVFGSTFVSVFINDIPPKPTIKRTNDTLTSSSPEGNQWYKDGKLIQGADSTNIYPPANGYYSVRITLNGCTSPMSDSVLIDDLSVQESKIFQTLHISPLPVEDFLYITGVEEKIQTIIQIYTPEGIKVLEMKPPLSPFEKGGSMEIDIRGLVAGLYFVQVGNKVEKFVKY